MVAYLQKAKERLGSFSSYTISQIPRSQNVEANALARLASVKDADQLKEHWNDKGATYRQLHNDQR